MRALIFDIFGDFAHFKRFYTTSSPLTFSFPPPPTVKGMLGAITGASKEEYQDMFSSERCKIAIRILSPVKKIRWGLNHINTKGNVWVPTKKGSHEARTQIRTEFLKEPAYRLFVFHESKEVFGLLVKNINEHKTVFTLSMGLSELLADFRYTGILEFFRGQSGEKEITTVIPLSALDPLGIILEEDKKYLRERIPVIMNGDRVVERYEDVLFETDGKPICARVKEYWEGENGECVFFF